MPIATWKPIYFHTPANTPMTTLEAVDHSILKWEGMQLEVIAQHQLEHHSQSSSLIDEMGYTFWPGSDSCALCVKFNKDSTDEGEGACDECPLAIARGHDDEYGRFKPISCDSQRSDEKEDPWSLKATQPEVMLMWLKTARRYVIDNPERF
jgi:hypothetical protein